MSYPDVNRTYTYCIICGANGPRQVCDACRENYASTERCHAAFLALSRVMVFVWMEASQQYRWVSTRNRREPRKHFLDKALELGLFRLTWGTK